MGENIISQETKTKIFSEVYRSLCALFTSARAMNQTRENNCWVTLPALVANGRGGDEDNNFQLTFAGNKTITIRQFSLCF